MTNIDPAMEPILTNMIPCPGVGILKMIPCSVTRPRTEKYMSTPPPGPLPRQTLPKCMPLARPDQKEIVVKFEVQIGDLGTLGVFQGEILVKLCIAFLFGKRPVLLPDSMPNVQSRANEF